MRLLGRGSRVRGRVLLGRFLQQDEVENTAGQSYAYCGNNPTVFVDPDGRAYKISIRANEGHAWIVVRNLSTGEEHSYGTYMCGQGSKKAPRSGVMVDFERNEKETWDAGKSQIVNKVTIPRDEGWSYYFNCAWYASKVWKMNTGETISTGLLPLPINIVRSIWRKPSGSAW